MSYRTDYSRAHGLGSAHDGVHHFTVQRISAVALIPLTLLFIFPFANALGGSYEQVQETYRNWWNAFVAINFLIIGFWHLKLGLEVIIDDYVHAPALRVTLLLLNICLNWAFAAAGVFAVARIAFSG